VADIPYPAEVPRLKRGELMVGMIRSADFLPMQMTPYAGVAEGLTSLFQALLEKTQGTPSGAVTQTDGQQAGNSGNGQSGDIIKQLIQTAGDVLQTLITSITQLLQTAIQAVAPLLQQALQIAAPLLAAAGEAALAGALAA
jgi:hypothetical protein